MAYAAAEPDRMRATEDSEVILTCNQDFARGIFYEGNGYRTYIQTVSFIAINNSRNFSRAEYLRDVIHELAGYMGQLNGTVLNNMTGDPVPYATVQICGSNMLAISDENGEFEIRGIPHEQFDLEVSARGYTPLVIENLNFDGEQEMVIEIRLFHPELSLDREDISVNLEENAQQNVDLTVTNGGDGPLEFSADLRGAAIPGHVMDEFFGVHAAELLGNTRLQAAIFFADHYWIAGGSPDADSPNMLYKLNSNLEIVGQTGQSSESRYGWRDMTTDGTYIYAVDGDLITQINPETGEEADNSIQSNAIPRSVKGITYDPENDLFWVASTTSDLFAIDRDGNEAGQIENDGQFRCYGLIWDGDDDGYNLHIQSRVNQVSRLLKCNPNTGDVLEVLTYDLPDGEKPCGGEISTEVYPFTKTLVVICQGAEDWMRAIEIGNDFYWIDFEPAEGELDPESELDIEILISTANLEVNNQYSAFMQIEHNTPVEGPVWLEITLTVGGGQNIRDLIVPMSAGWNMISLNVVPGEDFWNREEGPDVILLTDQLRAGENAHHVEILKDEDGRFYLPAFNFNNIPYWNLTQGYQVKVDGNLETVWSGEPIPADNEIPLESSWNLIAYFPQFNLDASAPDFYVLSPIIDNVLIAKNSGGEFMLPAFNFSNMPPWRETQGYQVKLDEDLVFSYPPQQDEQANILPGSEVQEEAVNTGYNMSLLIEANSGADIFEGDMIIALNANERLFGSGNVMSDGRCGIAIWGDDPMTENIDGLLDNEAFTLWLQNEKSEDLRELQVTNLLVGEGLKYQQDGFSVIEVNAVRELPQSFYMSKNYPNPFNNITRIAFALPEPTQTIVSVFNVNGRLIAQIANDIFEAGYHNLIWNAEYVSAGLYIIKMQAGTFEAAKKVVLVK